MNIEKETAGWFFIKFFNKYFINIKHLIFLFSVLLIFFIACDFKMNSGNIGSEPKIIDSSFITEYQPLTELTVRQDIMNLITGNKYYLDAVNGNDDTGNGSSQYPWKTLVKVKGILDGGDGLILRTGNYGEFNDKDIHDDWVVIINEEGETPEFTNIKLRNNEVSPLPSLKLIFYGIRILPGWIDPASSGKPGCDDPQYNNSTQSTYAKTEIPVDFNYIKDVKFYNCKVLGQNKHLTTSGFKLTNSENIWIERCHIHTVGSGIHFSSINYGCFYYNKLDNLTGSIFRDGSGSYNIIIEGNNGYNSNWNKDENYCPRLQSSWYHGSYVSIRSSNIIVRNNIFHDGCNSSGIMLYTGYDVYHNILIENNLLYDTHNPYVFRIYNLGKNIIIRNNTFVGKGRNTSSGARKYNAAFTLHSTAPGYNGSGLHVYNNIFVGSVRYRSWITQINESNNIYWSLIDQDGILLNNSAVDSTSNVVSINDQAPDYFESGFFSGIFDVSWPDMYSSELIGNPPGHGNVLDLTLANGSESINFGDPNHQPNDSLGNLDTDGFLQPNGKRRDENSHSAGCYEM